MDEETRSGGASFDKQRRSLMLVSVLLFFLYYAEVRINEFSLVGAKIQVSRPEALRHVLWGVWVYFVLRYYQYWKALKSHAIRMQYNEHLRWVIKRRLRKRIDQHLEGKPKHHHHHYVTGFRREGWWTNLLVVDTVAAKSEAVITQPVRIWSFWVLQARAYWRVAVHETTFTDYVLPLLLAGVAFVYSVVKEIGAPW